MDIRQTLLLYLLLGVGVAIGFAARSADRAKDWLTILAAWVFWPLFMPLLLSPETAEPAAKTPTIPERETLARRIARCGELLDLMAALPPSFGVPDLPENISRIKARWNAQFAWLTEANSLALNLDAVPSRAASGTHPAGDSHLQDLKRMQKMTTETLHRSLNRIDELAVLVQLLKAPGVNHTAELERIERVLTSILELDATTAASHTA